MFPAVVSDLTPLRVAAIVAVIVFGYPLHELCHAAVLVARGVPFDVELAPSDRSVLVDLLIGRAVLIEPRREVTPLEGLAFALAPGALAIPAIYLWAQLLVADRVSLASLLFVAAWFIVFLPSALDWLQATRCVAAMRADHG